jgi:hypothetical protein
MKISRIALFTFAAFVGISSLFGSARSSDAGGLGLDWLSNKPYVECVKRARLLADVSSVIKGPVYREASYDRSRRACNQRYYGHQ